MVYFNSIRALIVAIACFYLNLGWWVLFFVPMASITYWPEVGGGQ